MTSVDPSASAHWFERLPPMLSSPRLRVHTSQITEIADVTAVHPLQRFARTWRLDAADAKALRKLRLATPGLTIVRVDATAFDSDDAIARVRVTSDESQHLDCVKVAAKKSSELCVEFTNTTHHEGEPEHGTLVVEVVLAHAQQIDQIVAMGGGDVSVHSGVVVNSIHQSATLAALHESQLWINERATRHLQLKELIVGSAAGGDVYIHANDLTVRETLTCGVLGGGRIHLVAPRTWSATSLVAVMGDRGSVQIKAVSGFATEQLTGLVKGSGECIIQSSPGIEFGQHTTCKTQLLTVEGCGSLDVAGVPADCCRVKARGGARIVVQPRHKLRVDSSPDAVIGCVGLLPRDVRAPKKMKVVACVSYHDRLAQQRVREATAPTATLPKPATVETAFDSPYELHVTKAGFRATFFQPFLNVL